jgi:DNA-binding transcriptional LysR family regulator
MTEADSLSGLVAFVTAIRTGSFTQAADRLGLTKSAVGKSVTRLEARLGVKLLHRSTRQLKLTVEGELYFQACAKALDDIAEAEAQISPVNGAIRGRVHVDMPVAFGRRVLLPILLDIARPHPALTLTMSFNDATINPLTDQVDVIVRFGDVGDSPQLVARRLSSQARVLCASPAYLAEHGTPQGIDDLMRHRCIVGSSHGPPTSWALNDGERLVRVTPPATHQFNDGEAMVDAAVAGFGICQMPASLVRQHINRGRLLPVLAAHCRTPVDVHVMWLRKATLSPRVRYVVDQLIARGEAGELD